LVYLFCPAFRSKTILLRHHMKPTTRLRLFLLGSSLLATTLSNAATFYWDSDSTTAGFGNTDGTWGTDTFWSTVADGTGATANTTTTSLDDLNFGTATDGYTGGRTVTVNSTQLARLLTFGAASGSVALTGGTISLGTGGGITVAAGAANDATISSDLTISGSQTFNIGSGRTLTLSTGSTFTRNAGAVLNFRGTGTVTSTMTNLAAGSMVNGIVGPWASFGTGASTQYATFSGDNIAGFTGTTSTVAAIGNAPTANYEVSAGGTLGASASINTLRFTGASGTIAGALSTKGIINVGGGNLIFSGASTIVGEMVVNAANGSIELSGLVSGGALTKTGSGTLYLNGSAANTYTGTTTINGGVVRYSNRADQIGSGNLTFSGGILENYWDATIAARALGSGAGQIQILGGESGFSGQSRNQIVPISNSEVVWGSEFFNPSVFILGSANATAGITTTLNKGIDLNGATRTIASHSPNAGAAGVISGAIRDTVGGAGITKTGVGELILSSTSNSYTGTTTVSQGILTANSTTALPGFSTTGKVSVAAGATIAVRTGAWTAANIDSLRGAATWSTTGSILGINTTTGNFAYNSDITGAHSISKLGTNTLTLGGNSSYSGATIIAAGTLSASTTTALGAGDITFKGGTLQYTAAIAGTDWATRINNSTSAITLDTNSQSVTLAGNIGSANTGGLTKVGAGTLTLSGTNAYTGATTVSVGILRAGAAAGGQAFGSNSAVTLANTAGVALDLNGFNQTIGSLAGGGTTGGNLNLGSGTLTLGGDGTGTTFAGNITGTGGLIKNGGGALTLSGTTTNYSGGFTLNAGNVVMPSSGTYTKFGTGVVTINGGQFQNATSVNLTFENDMVWNAIFTIAQTGSHVFNGDITLGGNTGLNAGSSTRANNATFNGNIGETGGARSFSITGSTQGHSLTFNGQNTFTGAIVGHGATALTIGGTGYLGGGSYAGNITAGTLTYSSSANQTLSGSVTSTNGVFINAGTLQFAKQVSLHNNSTGNWTAAKINVKSGGTLALNVGGTGEFTTGNVTTLLTNLAASSSSTNGMNAGSNFGFDTTNASGGMFSITNIITDSTGVSGGARGVTKLGAGTLVLTNSNTYTGTTTVAAGTLALGANEVLPNGSPISIANATLNAATFTETAGTLDVTAASTINLDSGATLAFADSSGVDWTGGTLNITGTLGATSLRFGTNASGLTPAQRALISVNGSGNYTLDADGYLIPASSGSPEISVDPSAAAFGNVTLGSHTSQVFTIANSGSAPLNLTGTPLVAVSGTNAADFTVTATPTSPVTSSGGTTTFTVRFAPSAAGARSALLTIANDDSDEGTFTIAVSGTGQTSFDAWSAGAAFDADSNGDGVDNGLAFLLGAANPNDSALGLLPTANPTSGGDLVLNFNILKSANRGAATVNIEHSNDLGTSDAWAGATVPETTSTVNGVDFTITPGAGTTNNVQATIPSSEAASGKLFGRIKAQP